MIEQAITFDDVYLVPGYNDIASRADVNICSPVILPFQAPMTIPIISSNMDTITGPDMARAMTSLGGMGILHRFCTIEDNIKMFDEVGNINCGVSIGIGENAKKRADALWAAGARIFCVDVAHGHSKAVGQIVKWLDDRYRKRGIWIIAGNVATYAGADYLASCGADAIKIGIGPGSACTTRIQTGVGVPQITAIEECSRVDRFLIADGGIRRPGDAAKALAAGADAVMLGGQLAGCDETPGDMYTDGKGMYGAKSHDLNMKEFRGMASKEAQEDFMGAMADWKTTEGVSHCVKCKGPVANVLRDFAGGIRSAFTYVGARNMEEFHRKARFVRVTAAGRAEGEAHIRSL